MIRAHRRLASLTALVAVIFAFAADASAERKRRSRRKKYVPPPAEATPPEMAQPAGVMPPPAPEPPPAPTPPPAPDAGAPEVAKTVEVPPAAVVPGDAGVPTDAAATDTVALPTPYDQLPGSLPPNLDSPRPPTEAPPPGQAPVAPSGQRDRSGFVKGELTSGAVQPLTQRNFAGVAAGVSAIPNSPGSLVNTFFLTVEPQLYLQFPKRRLAPRIGLGVPLQFGLVDFRGPVENCIPVAKMAASMPGATEQMVISETAPCLEKQKDNITHDLGKLRKRDWDEPSDFAKVIRYVTLGGEERPFYLNMSRLYGQSLGHGTVVRRYNANLNYNTARVGATLDAYYRFVGFESMINDVVNPDVFGLLAFVRPFEPFTKLVPLRSLSFGVDVVGSRAMPSTIQYEKGLANPSFGQPIPRFDSESNIVAGSKDSPTFVGVNAESKLIRTNSADMKLYLDMQKMLDYGTGYTLGSLWRFSFGGDKPFAAIRLRAELQRFDSNYLPAFFNSFHDVHKFQYLPASYVAGPRTYYPTKLEFLKASADGDARNGGYLEATFSLLKWVTVSAAIQGSGGSSSYAGPAFTDYSGCMFNGSGTDETLDCSANTAAKVNVKSPGYTSMLLHAEIPFQRYLQAFATYEVFSSTTEGLQMLALNGENEIFFSGARIMLLPVLFIQAEARRYYFLQRLASVDLDKFTFTQDQNYHAQWTFALNLAAGWEF